MAFLFLAVLIGLVSAFLTSQVADSKGWEGTGWFFAGLLFGPIALIAVVGLPDKKLRQYVQALALKLDAIEADLPQKEALTAQDSIEFTVNATEKIEIDYQKLLSLLDSNLVDLISDKYSEITPKNIILRDIANSIIVNARSVANGKTRKWRIVYRKRM